MSATIISKTFKQKDRIIKQIGMNYKKITYSNSIVFMVREEETLYNQKENIVEYYKELKRKVDYILIHMDEELSKVIYNEYLSTNVKNWWIYYYSKSTYYRMKNKAMDNFLEWWYA